VNPLIKIINIVALMIVPLLALHGTGVRSASVHAAPVAVSAGTAAVAAAPAAATPGTAQAEPAAPAAAGNASGK
jgi:K(+)-stimulated pyrophosphate-energized sodium pump